MAAIEKSWKKKPEKSAEVTTNSEVAAAELQPAGAICYRCAAALAVRVVSLL
jgi:hypothetical protein